MRNSEEGGVGGDCLAACSTADLSSLPWRCPCACWSAEHFQSHPPLGLPTAASCSTDRQPQHWLGRGRMHFKLPYVSLILIWNRNSSRTSVFFLPFTDIFSGEFSEVKRKCISLETSWTSKVFECMMYASCITPRHQFASIFETLESSILLQRMTRQQEGKQGMVLEVDGLV